MRPLRSKRSRRLHHFLIGWACKLKRLTPERLVTSLACESVDDSTLKAGEQDFLTQFRHLNQADRLRVSKRAVASLKKAERLFRKYPVQD